MHSILIVRVVSSYIEKYPLLNTKSPFVIEGASNVFLETIKRGEDDDHSGQASGSTTVVLRLYEAFGGHAKAKLIISGHIPVAKASITNLLEDETEQLQIQRAVGGQGDATSLTLDFHGFEVKTVQLHIGPSATAGDERSD